MGIGLQVASVVVSGQAAVLPSECKVVLALLSTRHEVHSCI